MAISEKVLFSRQKITSSYNAHCIYQQHPLRSINNTFAKKSGFSKKNIASFLKYAQVIKLSLGSAQPNQ